MSRREKEKEKEERKEKEKGRGQASLLKDVLRPAHRSHLDEGSISNVNHMVKKFEQPMQDTRESRGASNSKLGHNTRLGRSESWKGYSDVHHKVCHPGSPRSMSDVDLSAGRGTIPKQRPSLKLTRAEAAVPAFSDSLFENNANLMVEAEAFDWQASISRDVLKQLSNQTIKRQDVINELFHTERLHVKSLFVLKVLFRDNLVEKGVMEEALAENVFPHLASLLQQHGRINAVMRNMQQPGVIVGFIGDMLVEQAAESSPHCRRLQLKDLLPAEMQRLTKYPLLLKKLAKYSSENAEEQHKVQAATEHCCQILDHVNQSVREAENAFHLQGYQRKLDLSALQTEKNSPLCQYKNLNLTEHRMLHEGPLTWRLTKEKSIDLQVLLLQDLLVLLQKQEDRLVLRAHSLSTRVPGMSKQVYNPILPLGGLLLRDVARDGKAFFILYLSTNGALMYEFCAGSVSGRKAWWNAINLAQAACNSVSMVTVPASQRYREGNRAQSPPPTKPVDPDQGTKGIANEEGRCKNDSISASWQQEEIVKAALQSAGHIQVTLKDYFQRSRGKKEEMGTISSPSTPISPTPSTPISTTPSTPISPSPSTPIGLSLPTSIHLSVPQFGGIASNERETQDISTCSQVPVDFLIKNLQVTENEDGEEPKVDERHIDLLAREEDILGELAKLTQLLLTLKTETLPCDV
uniref:DH domain-containing protein n=1 Tax=Eptatretus burgeri TaxID=7764 RepID=A0A8C4NJX3_EPTBU